VVEPVRSYLKNVIRIMFEYANWGKPFNLSIETFSQSNRSHYVNVESGKNPLLERRWRAIAGDSWNPSCVPQFSFGRVNRFGATEIHARAAECLCDGLRAGDSA